MRRFITGFILFGLLSLFSAATGAIDAPLSKLEPLTIATKTDASLFTVEIADTDELRQRGLMFRQRIPPDRGMLFDFGAPRPVAMWMKNTYVSLDMLFIRQDGSIAYIAENTVPQSLDTLGVSEPVLAVLELAGGTSKRLGIRAGDTVFHRIFRNN